MRRYTLDQLPSTEINRLIDEWIHDERNRGICRRKWLDNAIYEDVAEEFGLSVQGVKSVIRACWEKINRASE